MCRGTEIWFERSAEPSFRNRTNSGVAHRVSTDVDRGHHHLPHRPRERNDVYVLRASLVQGMRATSRRCACREDVVDEDDAGDGHVSHCERSARVAATRRRVKPGLARYPSPPREHWLCVNVPTFRQCVCQIACRMMPATQGAVEIGRNPRQRHNAWMGNLVGHDPRSGARECPSTPLLPGVDHRANDCAVEHG